MKVQHTELDKVEHRVVIDLTALEASLLLLRQPVVLRELAKRVREALAHCDQKVKLV